MFRLFNNKNRVFLITFFTIYLIIGIFILSLHPKL